MKETTMRSALAETTWTDVFRRVRNRIALVAAAICTAAVPLSSQADTGPLNGTPDDVRVAPLLTTHWNQGSVGNALCYNYYTPLNRVCGCTATAVGQIMYYHKYPTTRILPGETLYDDIDGYGKYEVATDGNGGMTNTTTGAYTAFDPPYGGPYRWSDMVDSPTSSDADASAREAIGQLTRDAGFAVFSHYYTGETSGYTLAIASSIILNLHYADAVRTGFNANKLIANLDAGLPIQIGLTAHAVVADGYGYHNGKLYIHINYGYSGNKDGWYDPTTDLNGMNIRDMVANIFPPTRGARHSSVISGRVLDANGDPVANATVTATGATNVTTNSNAHGVYSFILPAGSYTFTATSGDVSGTLTRCVVEASEQMTRGEFEDPYNQRGWETGVNNSQSGVNVTLGKTATMNEPDAYLEYVQSDGSQYIDPELRGRTNMRIEADIDWISGRDVVGCTWNECYPLQSVNGNIGGQFVGSGTADTGVGLNTGRHLIVADATLGSKFSVKVYNVNGEAITQVASATSSANAGSKNGTGDCGNNIHVFGAQFADADRCSAKLYGMKIYLDGGLVRDFVPAVKGGVAGLYDCKNDKWYAPGAGTLTAGPVVLRELKEQFHTSALGRFAKRAQDFDVGDYVQTGLIAHFDGIRNAGANLPHDPTTRTWKNLVSGQPDAKFYCNNAISSDGSWNVAGNGFFFDGQEVAMLDSPGIDVGTKFTFQIVTDIDLAQQHTSSSTGAGPYTGQYPTYFTPNTVDDGFFSNNGSGTSYTLNFKHNDGAGWVSGGSRPSIATWEGKYATGIVGDNMAYLVQGTELVNGVSCSGHKSIGARQYTWAGKSSGTDRFIYGTYHSVRMYTTPLTEDQLAQNRYIDEMRFRGAFTSNDVDIVIATSTPGVEGVEPSGEYMVNGSHTFSARDVIFNGSCWTPTGYTLEKWNENSGTWTHFADSEDTSFAYTNCLANGKMRLTWTFNSSALSAATLTHRWSFTSDYSDSVGGSTGTAIGSALAIENGEVVMSGNGNSTGSLNLGAGLMPSGDATIEIWATRTGVKKWARVLDIGSSTSDYFIMTWVNDTNGSGETVILRKNGGDNRSDNTMLYADNVKYHISVTFKVNGDGSTTIAWARRNVETGAVEKSGSNTYSSWTLAALSAGNFYLGHSQWSSDFDANARYDEVRIWNGVLSDDQLTANASMGPDAYASGFEEGFDLAPGTTFKVPEEGYSASGIVALGVGSKLRFDTANFYTNTVSFSATGYSVPSGDILDYVELTDPSKYAVTLSGDTITLTRVRRNEPDTYVEYVESDGRQAVNTGVTPGPTTSVSPAITSMMVDADVDWISGNRSVLVGSTWNNFEPLKSFSSKIGGFVKNSGETATAVELNSGRHHVVSTAVQGQKLTIDVDDVRTTSGGNVAANGSARTLYVFASNDGTTTGSDRSTAKLYGLKIYINGKLVRDFVPGIKDGVAGLYDRQKDEWLHSGSGTELIPGPVVNPQNVPDAYLDYVKSTGAQWVDTELLPSRTMTVEADLDWISGNAMLSQNYYDIRVLSANNGYIASSTYSYSSYATSDLPLDSGRHHIVVKSVDGQKLTLSVDGAAPAVAGSASNRSCSPPSLYIFAAHSGSGTGYSDCSTAKLYGLKIYGANGALVRDYIPGIKDNVVGLYDRVNDKFVKSGSGTPLVAGPIVERSKPDAFVEYVESTGSQWVDTGVDGRAGVKSEADIDWMSGVPLAVYGNNHCFLLQDLNGIGGQALGSGEVKTFVALNSGRHLIVSEVGNGSKMTVTVDGTTSALSANNVSSGASTGATIWMFAAHSTGGGAWGAGRSKFYGLKLWRTGSDGVCRIQRHFIPCVKGNRAGLYDAVSGVIFYSHSGTDLTASSTTRTLSVWRNEADDASLDNAANWCGGLPNGTDAVVCAPWLPAVSSTDGLVFTNLTVSGGNLAFANGTNTITGTLTADGALAFTNLVINGSADCAVAISGFISGHGTVKSLTLDDGARFVPDGIGYLTVSDALAGTVLIDMTDIDLKGKTGRFPLFKTASSEILPVAGAVTFVGGKPPSRWSLSKAKSGFGYDLAGVGFFILLR